MDRLCHAGRRICAWDDRFWIPDHRNAAPHARTADEAGDPGLAGADAGDDPPQCLARRPLAGEHRTLLVPASPAGDRGFRGTRLLIVAPNEPFVLLLAAVLFVYLNMERLGKTNVRVVCEHPQASAVVFGLVAGVFEGTANVSGPPLLVYFLLIGLSPRAIVQTLNFAFVAGKLSQTVTWTVSGGISLAQWAQTLPWVLLAAVTLVFGRRIHDRLSAFTYMRWLRGFLWAMVALLIAQFIRLMVVRFI